MKKFIDFITNEKNHKFVIPAIAIFLGFFVGSIILILTGQNPIKLFTSIIRGVLGIDMSRIGSGRSVFNARYVGEYFVFAMPIILTGLSVAFAFRTGLFNIGAEGQLLVGSFASVAAGVTLDLPGVILLPVVILSGTLAGAIWGFVPGILKAKFNVHEVVVTIMMNYTALYLTNYYLKQLPGSDNVKSIPLPAGATLKSEFLIEMTNRSRLHWGFILVIIAIFIFWYIIEKTTFGYELKAVGYNPHAARYAGMKVERNAALSMAIAGAFSGLAGTVIAIGTFGYGRVLGSFENYGFEGIAVALVGGNTALGSVFGGLLFGSLSAAQPVMQSSGIPRDIAIIISSTIILFVAMQNGIKIILKRIKGAK
ncbi:MAG: ABC transporter permease [Firmicutes bacterium HGW-Firmicutes-2]|jgi:simple sugar transport system permease protein|nr:MAG: ABC transporter permease [Firmicutes bacterium HGW-Firmicutes-2]